MKQRARSNLFVVDGTCEIKSKKRRVESKRNHFSCLNVETLTYRTSISIGREANEAASFGAHGYKCVCV